jgi:hypothetical protein
MSTIAVDFDGTICNGGWPDINRGRPNKVVINWLKKRQDKGDKVVLWTCRENYGGKDFPDGEYKNEAVSFCTRQQLFFANVNANAIGGDVEHGWEREKYGRKIRCDFYLDDRSVWFNPANMFLWRIYLWLVGHKLDRESRKGLE